MASPLITDLQRVPSGILDPVAVSPHMASTGSLHEVPEAAPVFPALPEL